MILTYYSLFLGKKILRSFKFDDIETWNQQQQQKKDSRIFLHSFQVNLLVELEMYAASHVYFEKHNLIHKKNWLSTLFLFGF